ncbi:hypothetical protein GGI07_004159 [Coemansia sp. Benny D115]|nr:hypothetical protein GGI07_004159 [Coemansia sp. Benny D115]
MPRAPANNTLIPLLRKLSEKLGEQQAKNELRWMVDHVHATLDDTRRPHSDKGPRHTARLWRDQPARSPMEIEQDGIRFRPVQWAWLRQAVAERTEKHKPLQYILGDQPFGQAKIAVRPPVLIPRWETEEWMLRLSDMLSTHVARARDAEAPVSGRDAVSMQQPLRILDACTGSGCVALGMACALPEGSASITGVDISDEALALAGENLALNSMLAKNKVDFLGLDIQSPEAAARLQGVSPRWDMIVANPPYVTPSEYSEIDPDVREWEDIRALVPLPPGADPAKVPLGELDPSGVAFIVRLAKLAQEMGLSDPRGPSAAGTALPRIVVEIGGEKQVEPVCQAMHDHGLNSTEVWKDMAGSERVVLGYLKV